MLSCRDLIIFEGVRGKHSCDPRGSVANIPYLIVILGETGYSGHGLGFGEIAKLGGLPPFWERFAE